MFDPQVNFPGVIWSPNPRFQRPCRGLHFGADNIGLSSLKFFRWAQKCCLFLQEWRFSRSRSSKVIDVGINWKRVCDFLLVDNNLSPIVHRFQRFCSFYVLPLILGCFNPLHQIALFGVSERISLISSSAVKLFAKNSDLCDHGT